MSSLEEVRGLRHRISELEGELRQVRKRSMVAIQAAEAEEECLVNRMMKSLTNLKKEKEDLAIAVEQEEELLTNTLQRRLSKLLTEKEALERRLRHEREAVRSIGEDLDVATDRRRQLEGLHEALALSSRASDQLSGYSASASKDECVAESVRTLTRLQTLLRSIVASAAPPAEG